MKLADMQLFHGLKEDDIASLLSCLNSVIKKERSFLQKGVLQRILALCCLAWQLYPVTIFGEIQVF